MLLLKFGSYLWLSWCLHFWVFMWGFLNLCTLGMCLCKVSTVRRSSKIARLTNNGIHKAAQVSPPPPLFVFVSLILMNLFEDLPALLGDKRGLHQHGCSFFPLTFIYSPALLCLTSSLSSPVCPQSPLHTHPSLPLSLPPPLSVCVRGGDEWVSSREGGGHTVM